MYTNSSLVNKTQLSPNYTNGRTESLERITPHCFVGDFSVEEMLNYFSQRHIKASANYVIDMDGKIGLCVEEKNRSWCSSNGDNDNRAITIECSSGVIPPYFIDNIVLKNMVNLIIDICNRYNKNKVLWIPDKEESLKYQVKSNELLITVHRWFANKECPGDYMISELPHLVDIINSNIGNKKEELSEDMQWAIETGLIQGYGNGQYGPKDYLTREQLATVLRRFYSLDK